jgi:molybdopterin molybdotransferase
VNSAAEASEQILARINTLEEELVPTRELLGRVLTHPTLAHLTMPPWDNSAMDGYAVRAADIERATEASPVVLPVSESVAAGGFPSGALAKGTAIRIMTGAPVPEGADTVIRVEDTDAGLERVAIKNARDVKKNIRPRGEDFKENDVILEGGTALGPAQIGVLASLGAREVMVPRRPRVAFLTSGDELVDVGRFKEVLAEKKIISSNSYTLHAMISANGGIPIDLGIARDDKADIKARMLRARDEKADLLITSAGISAGEADYVRTVLGELGLTMDVWKVPIRPGAQLGFGLLGEMPWIGLPGNPVSTMVTFELFVRPIIRKMLGHTQLHRRPVPVTLEETVTIGAKLTHFMRAIVTMQPDGALTARLTGPQGSGILTSMSRANALLIVPEDRPRVEAGARLNALLLNDSAASSSTFSL